MSTNKIQHKRSSTENNPPTSLDAGEIAINTNANSANIHFEDADGDMRSVGSDPTDAGTYVRDVSADGEVGTWVAANATPGGGDGSGDYGFWSRDDSTDTLSPRTADDNLDMGAGDITTTGDISGANGTFSGDVTLDEAGENLILTGSDNTSTDRTISISAPTGSSAFGANYSLTLPPDDGTANQVLATDGDGALSWVDQTGGGGGGVTRIIAGTNVTISPTGGTGNVTVNASGSGDTINYNGAAAWGEVDQNGNEVGTGLNFTSERTTDPGVYRITFTNAMPSTDYSIQVSALNTLDITAVAGGKQATEFLVRTFRDNSGATNSGFTFAVFATNALPSRGTTGVDAWANTGGDGSLNGSYNLAVDLQPSGVFNYTFINRMPNANYGVQVSVNSPATDRVFNVTSKTATGFSVQTFRVGTGEAVAHAVLVNATNAQLPDTVTQEQIDWAVGSSVSAWAYTEATGVVSNGLNLTATRTGEGTYQYTFGTALATDNYSVQATAVAGGSRYGTVSNLTSTGFQVNFQNSATAPQDVTHMVTVQSTNSAPPKGTTGADAFASTATDASLLSSYNIASCTRPSNGRYDYVFGTTMPTANYAVTATSDNPNSGRYCTVRNKTRTGFSVFVWNSQDEGVNGTNGMHSVAVFATNAQLPDTVTQDQIDRAVNGSAAAWGVVNQDGTRFGAGLNFATSTLSTNPGVYTITFTNAMPSAEYSVQATPNRNGGQDNYCTAGNFTTTGFTVQMFSTAAGLTNAPFTFTVFATNSPAPKGGTGADAWAFTSGAANLSSSYNFASCTVSNGEYSYVFSTPMPSQNYAVVATASSATGERNMTIMNQTANGFTAKIVDLDGSPQTQSHSVVVHATNAQLPAPLTQDDLLFTDGRNASTSEQEFEDGIEISGGDFSITSDCTSASIATAQSGANATALAVSLSGNGSAITTGSAIRVGRGAANGSQFVDYRGVQIQDINTNTNGESRYGVWSNISGQANGTNYNFYSEGSAANFFRGYVITRNAFICSPDDDWEINPPQSEAIGFSIRTSGNLLSYLGDNVGAWHHTVRAANGNLHQFGNDVNKYLGAIRIASGALQYFDGSDYRLKQNIADLGSAVEQVKNLRPVSYEMKTDPGYTHVGFLAHEVQQVVPQAVVGEKDAVETIGTLTTAEGDVETNVPEPEAIPYGSTWEATGTRDDIQMMSKSNLIPILTKALQETIAENEALKLRIEALESGEVNDDATDSALLTLVANLSTRIAALEAD